MRSLAILSIWCLALAAGASQPALIGFDQLTAFRATYNGIDDALNTALLIAIVPDPQAGPFAALAGQRLSGLVTDLQSVAKTTPGKAVLKATNATLKATLAASKAYLKPGKDAARVRRVQAAVAALAKLDQALTKAEIPYYDAGTPGQYILMEYDAPHINAFGEKVALHFHGGLATDGNPLSGIGVSTFTPIPGVLLSNPSIDFQHQAISVTMGTVAGAVQFGVDYNGTSSQRFVYNYGSRGSKLGQGVGTWWYDGTYTMTYTGTIAILNIPTSGTLTVVITHNGIVQFDNSANTGVVTYAGMAEFPANDGELSLQLSGIFAAYGAGGGTWTGALGVGKLRFGANGTWHATRQ